MAAALLPQYQAALSHVLPHNNMLAQVYLGVWQAHGYVSTVRQTWRGYIFPS